MKRCWEFCLNNDGRRRTLSVELILLSNAGDRTSLSFIHIHVVGGKSMMFLGNAIHKRHTWIGRRAERQSDRENIGRREQDERKKDNANGAAGDVEAEQS